jgi:hypothetical protein
MTHNGRLRRRRRRRQESFHTSKGIIHRVRRRTKSVSRRSWRTLARKVVLAEEESYYIYSPDGTGGGSWCWVAQKKTQNTVRYSSTTYAMRRRRRRMIPTIRPAPDRPLFLQSDDGPGPKPAGSAAWTAAKKDDGPLIFLGKKCEGFARATKRPVGRLVALVNSNKQYHTKPFAEAIGLVCVADAVDRLVRFGSAINLHQQCRTALDARLMRTQGKLGDVMPEHAWNRQTRETQPEG